MIFLDSRFHGNDNNGCFLTFYEFIKNDIKIVELFQHTSNQEIVKKKRGNRLFNSYAINNGKLVKQLSELRVKGPYLTPM